MRLLVPLLFFLILTSATAQKALPECPSGGPRHNCQGERERVAAAIREQAELEKSRLAQANVDNERRKREAAEALLLRPMISPQDPRIKCEGNWYSVADLSAISKRISLTGMGDISFQMLADNSTANQRDQQAIAVLAENQKKCIDESYGFRNQNYSKDLLAILDQEDLRILELNVDLYNKNLTYGKYNFARQQLAKDTRRKLDDLGEKLRLQAVRQEEAAKAEALAAEAAAKARQVAFDERQRQEQQRRTEAAAREQAMKAAEARERADVDRRRAECRERNDGIDKRVRQCKNSCEGIYLQAFVTARDINQQATIMGLQDACTSRCDMQLSMKGGC
jgi:hypothetical protein